MHRAALLQNDASLSSLSLNSGTLTPAFSSATTSYSASVANNVTSVNVTPATNSGGTVKINGSTATSGQGFSVPLNVGSNTITIVVTAADGTTTKTYTLTVTRAAAAPTISVSSSSNTPALGASVTFTATLSGGSSPTGTVTFKDGSTTLGTGTISGTTATYATSALTAGAHSITAVYGGDTNNATATSTAITVTVGQAAPTISVSSSSNTPALGASVTFTATLSGGSSPTGTVTFKDGSTTLGTGTISGTTATYSTSALTAGAHSITPNMAVMVTMPRQPRRRLRSRLVRRLPPSRYLRRAIHRRSVPLSPSPQHCPVVRHRREP